MTRMKKAKSGKSSSAAKSRQVLKTKRASRTMSLAKTVEEYLAVIPEPARSTLNKVRAVIRSVVPPETKEVISYRIPAFRYKGILVWYAAFSEHCSLFPTAAVIEALKNELKSYTISKGTIQFPIDKPLAAALIKKIVRVRIKQNESKKKR